MTFIQQKVTEKTFSLNILVNRGTQVTHETNS